MEAAIIRLGVKPYGFSEKKTFSDALKDQLVRLRMEGTRKPSTMRRLTSWYSKIESFLQDMNYQDLPMEDLKIRHMEELRAWLRQHTNSEKRRWISRHLEECRRCTQHAVRMGHLNYDPLAEIKTERDAAKEIIALSASELRSLMQMDFGRLSHISDVFIFQCWTGMSYGDLATYEIIERNGKQWITNQRQKNRNPYFVPLYTEARRIHDKYQGELPIKCNQEYNRALKYVARIAGVDKVITSHVGRKTFASLRDQEGWSPRTIAQMCGNTIRVLEVHYLATSTRRIEEEFELLGSKAEMYHSG